MTFQHDFSLVSHCNYDLKTIFNWHFDVFDDTSVPNVPKFGDLFPDIVISNGHINSQNGPIKIFYLCILSSHATKRPNSHTTDEF